MKLSHVNGTATKFNAFPLCLGCHASDTAEFIHSEATPQTQMSPVFQYCLNKMILNHVWWVEIFFSRKYLSFCSKINDHVLFWAQQFIAFYGKDGTKNFFKDSFLTYSLVSATTSILENIRSYHAEGKQHAHPCNCHPFSWFHYLQPLTLASVTVSVHLVISSLPTRLQVGRQVAADSYAARWTGHWGPLGLSCLHWPPQHLDPKGPEAQCRPVE